MKRNILLLLLILPAIGLFLSSCSDNSGNVQEFSDFAGWKSAKSSINSHLYALHFISRDSGWAGGDNGVVLFTSDGGENWIRQSTPNNHTIYSVHFIDRMNGWAAGGKFDNSNTYQPCVLRTSDAGETWKEISVTSDPVVFNSVEFYDYKIGWLVGVSKGRNYVARTIDGGANWIKLTNIQNERTITSIDVFDSLNVYLAGDSLVLATHDAGDSWLSVTPSNYIWITDIQFLDNYKGCICGWGGKFQKTNSSGLAWEPVLVVSGTDLYSISFTDELNGWAAGNSGALYHTTDGGLGWGKSKSPFSARINKVVFIDKDYGWFVGDYGLIYYTRSGGL